ncbi:circularly permuted type 2 ATP-grasp protein [Chitinophaga japonensis]|uniref:Glutathionylspermidine synthase n=1 Tax=Chitinophaga japonensis TaxID=104662 RepID=A0A562T6E9_CHIJA|nr:circularly permuted type 2 ATP-grasp protein [Chitinophaga japonensis]TWI88848.1 glutathionylspermidine synthase [Chitinophaga japonensis]
MVPALRTLYNERFTNGKYQAFLDSLAREAGEAPAFRVAETPVFVPAALTSKLVQACEEIVEVILQPDFKTLTQDAIPPALKVPGENDHPHFLIIDFAVCRQENGELAPQLIELQGFPSLFAFQELMARQYRTHFDIPPTVDNFFNGLDGDSYFSLLQELIIGNHDPREVVLLEVAPHQQKTRVDFYCTQKRLGIAPVCITELAQEGAQLYYRHEGQQTRIRRIYNRVIFDDLVKQHALPGAYPDLFQDLDVEWITHPNWYYRISKYMLPMVHSSFAPKSWYLHTLPVIPQDLEHYVLKPLFSYAGQGVIIDVTAADIDRLKDPENWILQHKVQYAPVIYTPSGPAHCEIRMMYIWADGSPRPLLVHNLARISKGQLIGVSNNNRDTWVGGSCCFFER